MTLFPPRLLTAAAGLAFIAVAAAQDGPQKLEAIRLTAGFHVITAEVAQTPEQRAIGLMNRPTMGANDGMLFVFERPGQQCFWMKNTLLPLSVAFLDDAGTVVNIEDMKPQDETTHWSRGFALYAVEMKQGWFASRGIVAGDVISGLPRRSKN